ncbi:S1C family serine protease [Cytobacillus kochii]|uniref:S1C family serine protease n=1 Tax=Cytobacillus kochii TaxID=859143 RepID=UPI00203BECC8|nr:trypsin-like peptidase domain-containing protein [Cytobacillus kochii]MCM3323613.1 trypsin-like peptidase domain-containing protein [Cytobacillus kochii]MCM3346206.1 trypsin-like peptidase domain-containing protein [Cytobacillus kochii]
MNEFNHFEDNREYQAKRKNTWIKSVTMTVASGVMGSALTLGAINYFPNETKQSTEVVQEQSETNVSKVNAETVSTTSDGSIADIVEKASKAIVGVVNMQEQQANPFSHSTGNTQSGEAVESGTGSGVIFKQTDNETYIVTNNHVIEGASNIQVSLHNGEKLQAELVGTDSLTDIAVLKVNEKVDAEVLSFTDSSNLRAGDQVLAIGNPLGLDLSRTVTQGIVSAVDRSIEVSTSAGEWDLNVIQTDAAINPGNSGGALIDSNGNLVGINSLKIADSGVEGLGFAIPSNDVESIIDQLMKDGKIIRPYLGVGLMDLNQVPQFYQEQLPKNVEEGAIITQVEEGSTAEKAGLQAEDILVSIGDQTITTANDLKESLYKDLSIGDKVKIGFYRDGEKKTVEVTLQGNGEKQVETE